MVQPSSSIVSLSMVFAAGLAGGLWWLGAVETPQLEPLETFLSTLSTEAPAEVHWPRVGEAYPDLELMDLDGQMIHLSKYRGRLLILEPAAICCSGCQAFSGGQEKGGYAGFRPQPGLPSFERLFSRYSAGASLSDPRLTFVQILFYGTSADRPPTLAEARGWAKHFGMDAAPNRVVLIAPPHLLSAQTWAMIPSFQLIDKNFILRADAGNPPRQNLYRELIPLAKTLLQNSN